VLGGGEKRMLLKEERGANDASENSLFSLLSSLFAEGPPIEREK
jgi:hypothetical protein